MADTPDPTVRSASGPDGGVPPQPHPQGSRGLGDDAAGDGAPLEPAAETTLWVGRTHWTHFAGSIALGTLAIVLATLVCLGLRSRGGVFGVWLMLVAACAFIVSVRIAWRVLSCRYRLTNQRFFTERGILGQTIDQTELIRVDDVRLRKTLPDRVFGLGSVEVLSTDQTDRTLLIEGIRTPETIAEHIRTNMRILRRKSLFVEKL